MTRKPRPAAETLLTLSVPQTPSEYVNLIRFRWYWIVVLVIVGAIGSQIAARFVPKRYVSKTVVLVESEKIPRDFIPSLSTERARDRLRTIHEEILARPRLERVLDDLNPYPEMIDVPRATVVDMIRRRTAILLRGRDAFILEYMDTDPDRAQRMATRLVSLFIEETSGARDRQAQGANEFIQTQLDQTKRDLEAVERRLSDVKQNYMGMLPNQLEANLATLQRFELERQSISDQIRAAKDRKSLLEQQLNLQRQMSEPEAQLVPAIVPQAGAGPAEPTSLSELRAYLAQLETRYTDEHPEVVAVRVRIKKLERSLEAQAESAAPTPDPAPAPEVVADAEPAASDVVTIGSDILVSDLQAQISVVERDIVDMEARQSEVQRGIATYQMRVEKIPEVEQELQALERDYQLISKYYSELLSRKLEAETAGAVEKHWKGEQFRVLDPAQVPEEAVYPNAMLFLLIGTGIGFGAGVGLSFLIEVLDTSVKSVRQLEAILPYPVLLTLPEFKLSTSMERKRRDPTPPSPPGVDVSRKDTLSAAS